LANIGNTKSTKTGYELMKEAGYSESMCKNPKMAIDSDAVKEGVKDFVKQLDDKRRMAITYLTEAKLGKSKARDIAQIVDILTKNHQLLSGGDTEKVSVYNWNKYEDSDNIQPKKVDTEVTRGQGEVESDSRSQKIGENIC